MLASRIRLEGRLEVVERMVAALDDGLAHARKLDFEPLWQALLLESSAEAQEARAHVERMSADDPALRDLVRRLEKLLRRAEQRVAERRRKLHLIPLPLLAGAHGLREGSVLYGGRPDLQWIPNLGTVALFITQVAMMVNDVSSLSWGIPVVLSLLLSRSTRLAPVRVMLTRSRLVLSERSLELDKVQRVEFTEQPTAFRMRVVLHTGERLDETLPVVEPTLVNALRARGIGTSRDFRPS